MTVKPAASTAASGPNAELRAQVQQGSLLRQQHRLAESVALLSLLVEQHPHDIAARNELALSLRLSGDTGRSLALSESVLRDQPANRVALMARIDTLIAAQDRDAALAASDAAERHLPGDLPLLLRRGSLLRQQHRLAESVALLSLLVEQHPHDIAARNELALSLRLSGDTGGSLALSESVLRDEPANRVALMARIDTLIAAQDQAGVIEAARSALAHKDLPPEALSQVLVRAVQFLPSIVTSDGRIWAHLEQRLSDLSGDQLLMIHDAYMLHGRLEKAATERLMQALFARPALSAPACEKIIGVLHSATPADFEAQARAVIGRALPEDRGYLELGLLALVGTAAQALALRRRLLPPQRKDRDALLLCRLLRQDGQTRLCARYLRFLDHLKPNTPQFLSGYLDALIRSGDIDTAERRLDALQQTAAEGPPQLVSVTINALVQAGRLEAALVLFRQTAPRFRHHTGVLKTMVGVAQSLGLHDDAAALLDEIRLRAESPHLRQPGPTLHGVMRSESALENRTTPSNDLQKLTHGAAALLRGFMCRDMMASAGSAQDLPDRIVHQYWDKAALPPDIRPLVRSWQTAEGFQHHLYDRPQARRLLGAELGMDWVAAFDNASSPAEESDFFRLCILVLRGGLYVDCDDMLVGNLHELHARMFGLTAFLEPLGHAGNNVIASTPRHPVTIQAAVAAKVALGNRHNDNTWFKTGPGLLSRVIAAALQEPLSLTGQRISLYPQHALSRHVQIHLPLPYKRTRTYWNRTDARHAVDALQQAVAALVETPGARIMTPDDAHPGSVNGPVRFGKQKDMS